MGSLSVKSNLHADVSCWIEESSTTSLRRKRCYVTNLKHLFPTDLSRGAAVQIDHEDLPADVHCETPEKLRPEFVRRYAKLTKVFGLSADVGLAPPRAKPMGKYVHDGAEESLADLKRAVSSLTLLQTSEAVDVVSKVLKDTYEQENAPAQHSPEKWDKALAKSGEFQKHELAASVLACEKMVLVVTTLRAEGINMRFLGHVRSKIKVNSSDKRHAEIRRILLHEMVARVLKMSIYKILREANGFKGEQGAFVDAVKAQLGMAAAGPRADKSSDQIPSLEEAQKTKRLRRDRRQTPSDETCRTALVNFFNVIFARQYVKPKEPEIVVELEQQGADPDRVKEVANMALMIKELRKKNKETFPGAIDQAIVALKKEFVMVLESSGGAWAIRQIKARMQKEKTEDTETAVADVLLKEALPEDPFSVYWRETMRALLRRKYGDRALSSSEMGREWSVIEKIDLPAVVLRLQQLTGLKFHKSAHDKVKLMSYHPLEPASSMLFHESEIEILGASVKDNGLANCGRGWSLIYKARALPLGPPKMQLLQLSADLFKEHVQHHPNDWVANYDAGCALYDLAWASPPSVRYAIMRRAYRHFRHSHKVCPTWMASMLRLGDTVYSMTLMRQDKAIEADYVELCVAAADLLDHSLDYCARCGVWADQVYTLATICNGYRSQRLYALAGVTYNEWIGLGGDPEAIGMKWLLEHHKELDVEPADIGAMVNLIRATRPHDKSHGRLKGMLRSKTDKAEIEKSNAEFERIYFTNRHVTDACVVLISSRAAVGTIKHLDLSNTDNITGDALVALCEEHGESLESLVLTTTPRIHVPDIIQGVMSCYAEGFGRLTKLHLDEIKELTDKDLQKMAAKLPRNLTSLSLKYGLNVEDAGVIEIAKTQTNLMNLCLCGCEKLTDASILYIAHACVELQALDVTGCHYLTNESIVQFAYRTRRYYTGRKGIPHKGLYNHDDPQLVLADLVIKNRGKKKEKTADDDDEWVFDGDVALSDDPEALKAFELERVRKEKVKALRREIQEKEFVKTLKAARLTLDQVQQLFRRDGEDTDPNADKLIDLDEIAIRMGLEEPAARERRLRELERAQEQANEREAMIKCEEMVAQGMRVWQIARELNLEKSKVLKVKEKWELQNKVFNLLKDVPQEELAKYALQIKLPDCKVKKALLKDVNMQSRLFIRIQLSSGGAPKNSAYRPVISDLNFNVDTFLPKIIDKNDFLKIDLCEKPDSGPGKPLAYYKAPMPKFIDYPVDMKKVPLYGSAGFFQGQPVGIMTLCLRALGEESFAAWKSTMGDYDASGAAAAKAAAQNKMKEMADQAGAIADKVLERCVEFVVTQMLDYFDPFKQMKELTLMRCNKLTDFPVIEMVRSMPYITSLNVSGVRNITDQSLEYIGRLCPYLKNLDITGCVCVTDDGVAHVSGGCMELERINMDECTDLTDAAIAFFCNFDLTNRLKEVTYKGLIRTTQESLSQIASSSTSLTKLAVAGSPQYRDVQVVTLAQRCHKLVHLDLGWCNGLTDYGISVMAQNCPELQTLSLANCDSLTGTCVVDAALHCPRLATVDLTACLGIKDEAILELIRSALQLSWLSISNCELLGKQTLGAIADWGEGLTHLEMLGCSSMTKKDIFRFQEKVIGRMELVVEVDEDSGMYK